MPNSIKWTRLVENVLQKSLWKSTGTCITGNKRRQILMALSKRWFPIRTVHFQESFYIVVFIRARRHKCNILQLLTWGKFKVSCELTVADANHFPSWKFGKAQKNWGNTHLSACVPITFLALPNFHSCFYSLIETRHMVSIS